MLPGDKASYDVGFAALYDVFMQDAPYDEWLAWLSRETEIEGRNVVDLGCGTGRLTCELAKRGARVVGVDKSEEMLSHAAMRSFECGVRIEWLCQDLVEVRLPRPADIGISSSDSLNYLQSDADLLRAFAAVSKNLTQNGVFFFDLIGPRRVEMLKNGFSYELTEDAAVLFETSVAAGEIHYEVNAFVRSNGELYRRTQEHHVQRYFRPDLIAGLLKDCGFQSVVIAGDFGACAPEAALRLLVKAQK